MIFSLRRMALIAMSLASLALALWGWQWYNFLTTPLIAKDKPALIYLFKPGASIYTLAHDLTALGLADKPRYLIALAYLLRVEKQLRAGEYRFAPGTTASQLLTQIARGKVVLHAITVIEGWDITKMLAAINANPYLTHTLANDAPTTMMAALGQPDVQPEGQFFPNTYRFALGTPDRVILQQAYALMQKHLSMAWAQRAPGLPYANPYQALIVASIVEKETGQARERPLIAGVLLARLQKNMRLQIDSTVIYGMGTRYQGNLTKADLREPTPYNTYTNNGLPPTPICLPSLAAIQAALHPATTNLLYFVAKKDGSHYFSATLAEHNQAVAQYQLGKILKG